MLVGELPFQSPYYDHKRRGRLLRFAQRGLTPNHINAISDFTPGLESSLFCKSIFIFKKLTIWQFWQIKLISLTEIQMVLNILEFNIKMIDKCILRFTACIFIFPINIRKV